jgi:hypothetical protein
VRGGGAAAGSSLLREAEDGQICAIVQVRETDESAERGEGRRCCYRRWGPNGGETWPVAD